MHVSAIMTSLCRGGGLNAPLLFIAGYLADIVDDAIVHVC